MNDRLVWIDCEMTGLDTVADALIEVAALVTDFELNVLGEGVDIVIKPPPAALEQMEDIVRQMHTSSGLLDVLDAGVDLATAESRSSSTTSGRTFLRPARHRSPATLSGTDRLFLSRDMPMLEAHLHYRIVDVSSIKELARRWFPVPTSRVRRRPATTARWPTSRRASRSCATTEPRCSCPVPGRTRRQLARWPGSTADR
ncbi:MAG: oligoribonuclease [Nocardioidaceae bacterium]